MDDVTTERLRAKFAILNKKHIFFLLRLVVPQAFWMATPSCGLRYMYPAHRYHAVTFAGIRTKSFQSSSRSDHFCYDFMPETGRREFSDEFVVLLKHTTLTSPSAEAEHIGHGNRLRFRCNGALY
jgi:hypothetical protein